MESRRVFFVAHMFGSPNYPNRLSTKKNRGKVGSSLSAESFAPPRVEQRASDFTLD